MAKDLWVSEDGIIRKGTTFSELQNLFIDKITAKYIYEPLQSTYLEDDAMELKGLLDSKGFDIYGVSDNDGNVIGYLEKSDLEQGMVKYFIKNIDLTQVIEDFSPISKLLDLLSESYYKFVIVDDKIDGIITRADFNKPVVRIYIFGIISLFEMHLNFWINNFYTEDEWKPFIIDYRLKRAKKYLRKSRKKNNELTLLECLQFCDKVNILKNHVEFLERFEHTEESFTKFLDDLEEVRNVLAHSNYSIIKNLNWTDFTESISLAENFLKTSESIVREKAELMKQSEDAA